MSSDYVVIRSGASVLRDDVVNSQLSIAAIGLLTLALTQPGGVDLGAETFVGRGFDEETIGASMQELTDAGHRHVFTLTSATGATDQITIFSDESIGSDVALERFLQNRIGPMADEAKEILK
ncbi:hypothetical protein V5R04_00225 [Jonesiaceae bacterium BS-20]|uniref:Uncharacterized protein n=1 Tax=Jonesiaceae bacterium BS-20 TaxID=3120821 RepID=A0AAU7DY81_9MICO